MRTSADAEGARRLGIANNTIVLYTTDNGPHQNSLAGRRHDAIPQREKHQLGRRLPGSGLIRWPGRIKPGEISNEMFSGLDWFPTLLAAAGDTDIKEQAAQGDTVGRQDLQGTPRRVQPVAVPHRSAAQERAQRVRLFRRRRRSRRLRYGNWKAVFGEQRAPAPCSGTSRLPVSRSKTVPPAHGSLRAGRRQSPTSMTTGGSRMRT